MKWLNDNPIGAGLAGFCALLAVALLAISFLWMLPARSSAPADAGEVENILDSLPALADSKPLDQYSVVKERPLFHENRQPIIEIVVADEDATDGDEDLLDEEDVESPEVELTGVVITPSLRMVTLKQKGSEESLIAFEGKPLEGNFGTWQVAKIDEREALLMSGSGEELLLNLQVHDTEMIAPAPPETESVDEAGGEEDIEEALAAEEDEPPLTRAEEIRRRIAERREELRRAQEEYLSKDGVSEGEPRRSSYQEAIQSMVERSRSRDQGEDD